MIKRFEHPMVDDWRVTSVKAYVANDQRETVKSLLNAFEHIIVVTMSFPKEEVAFKGAGFGLIARYAYGIDYHHLLEPAVQSIAETLRNKGYDAYTQVDKGLIDERLAASLAGLGYLGKNQFLIHPKFGTYTVLGIVATNAPIVREKLPKDTCGDCRQCIDACPTGALDDGFNARLCTSNVTQMKAPLDEQDLAPLKRKVFGCDICQKVCPKNIDIKPVQRHETKADGDSQLHLPSLLGLSNKRIEKLYKDRAFAFRGGLVLKRNAFALLVNQNYTEAYPLMQHVYEQYKHVVWFEKTARRLLKRMAEKL